MFVFHREISALLHRGVPTRSVALRTLLDRLEGPFKCWAVRRVPCLAWPPPAVGRSESVTCQGKAPASQDPLR